MAGALVFSEKPCKVCGTLFQPNSARHLYCSNRCQYGEAVCEQCGKSFVRKDNTTGKYCSLACWYAAPGKRLYEDRACLRCGATFRPGTAGQKYCGVTCKDLAARRERTYTECQTCGKPLPFVISKDRKYCSRSCALTGQSRTGIVHTPMGSTAAGPNGYQLVKVGKGYPGAFVTGWMLEHRYVMEQVLGRPVEKHERIHHKNGNRADNRPENLELWHVKKKDPAGIRQADYHCAGCRCFEEPYEPRAPY